MGKETPANVGYGVSPVKTFTIPAGATGAAVEQINFGRNYAYLLVLCEDCDGVDAATTMSAQIAMESGGVMCDLYEKDTPGTKWVSGNIPATGTLAFLLLHAFGAQYFRLILSKVTTAPVTFKIYGLAESIQG
ncbi:MAG: hypothetical protein WC455_18255 [Dehalococcoidia bacterium]|jgi:hypothetical protein